MVGGMLCSVWLGKIVILLMWWKFWWWCCWLWCL